MSKTDLQVANIGLKGAIIAAVLSFAMGLIGSVIGAWICVYTTRQQISLGAQTVRLEYTYKELGKLEELSGRLNELQAQFKGDPTEAATQMVQVFQKTYRQVEPVSHLLTRDTWGRLQRVAFDLDACFWDTQKDPSVLTQRWPKIITELGEAAQSTLKEIDASKRAKQEDIARLTSLMGQ